MAENGNFPQLPKGVWRGVWDILRKTPRRKLDDKALAAELNVQLTAAKAYARELSKLGIIDSEGSPTDLANRWRQDGQSASVIDEILSLAYPDTLLELAPKDNLDRDKIIRWFMNEGLGEGSAKNKTATYIMVASGVPSVDDSSQMLRPQVATASIRERRVEPRKASQKPKVGALDDGDSQRVKKQTSPQLAVNIQIHISPDASTEQIDAIFSAMQRYFNDA